jgi:preprotein translocase subunit SecA
VSRKDEDDEVYRTFEEKVRGVIREIKAAQQKRGQPTLVGTTSIERSELVAEMLLSSRSTSRRPTRWNRSMPPLAWASRRTISPC